MPTDCSIQTRQNLAILQRNNTNDLISNVLTILETSSDSLDYRISDLKRFNRLFDVSSS